MSRHSDSDYVYRMPLWAILLVVATVLSVPALNVAAVVWLKGGGSWGSEAVWCVTIVALGLGIALLLARSKIVVGPKRLLFVLSRSELFWDDVQACKLVRFIGVEWLRIADRSGRTFRVLLSRPGGGELRQRLLERLGPMIDP